MVRIQNLLVITALAAVLGCAGTQQRKAVQSSSYSRLAFVPLEMAPGQTPYAAQGTDLLLADLSRAGFDVEETYPALPKIRKKKKADAVVSSGLARQRTGAVSGQITEAHEEVVFEPAVYDFKVLPPSTCCGRLTNTECPNVYDEKEQTYVSGCSTTHKRIQVKPARRLRKAAFALRLRLTDSATKAVVWEASERAEGELLSTCAEVVTTRLSRQLADKVASR